MADGSRKMAHGCPKVHGLCPSGQCLAAQVTHWNTRVRACRSMQDFRITVASVADLEYESRVDVWVRRGQGSNAVCVAARRDRT